MSDTHDQQQIRRATDAILAKRHGLLGRFVTREMAEELARAVLDAVSPQEGARIKQLERELEIVGNFLAAGSFTPERLRIIKARVDAALPADPEAQQ